MTAPPPTLDLVMIVRDEARCLARCLESVRPWVDGIIVLDTGSTDDTASIALAHGARVYHFAWCDDFAAARNAALSHSRADWRLVLDADEWILEGGAALREAIASEPAPWVGVVAVESACEEGRAGVSVNRISRLLPRGASYTGRIHEQVQCGGPRRALALRVGHDGYAEALRPRKAQRNQHLLRQALEETPGDPYLMYQLGKEAESASQVAEAAAWYGRAADGGIEDRPWALDLTVRRLHCLSLAGAHEAAVQLAGDQADRWSGAVDFHFVVGTLMLNWACAQPERAADCLPVAEASWRQCLSLGDGAGHDGAVKGRGGHLAAWNLMALHEGLGDAVRAAEFRELARRLRTNPHEAAGPDVCPSSPEATRSIQQRASNALGPRGVAH